MADRIIVSTEEMQQALSAYEAARDNMQQAYNQLNSARDSLDACWEGPAKVAYTVRWANIYSNLVKSDQAIQSAITGLQNTINVQNDAESNVGSKVSSVDVGTTPPDVF